MNPLLSILCITYNHDKFISEAIDSWLEQKIEFQIEIIIADDCSTDNTVLEIKKYLKSNNHQLNLAIIYQKHEILDYKLIEVKIKLLLSRLKEEL